MTDGKKLTICVAERFCSTVDADDNQKDWHHCFLLLVEEPQTPNGQQSVIQQLHFVNRNGWIMVPHVRDGMSTEERFNDLDLFPCLKSLYYPCFEFFQTLFLGYFSEF